MEDTLGGYYSRVNQSVDCDVLILVLMEDTLGAWSDNTDNVTTFES